MIRIQYYQILYKSKHTGKHLDMMLSRNDDKINM